MLAKAGSGLASRANIGGAQGSTPTELGTGSILTTACYKFSSCLRPC